MDTKSNRFHLYLSAFILNLSYFLCGMKLSWSSPVLVKLPLTNAEGSRVASMLALGATLGPFASGALLNRIGRKGVVGLSLVLLGFALLLLTFGETVMVLSAARLMCGLFIGISFAAIPIYIAEISEDSIRGFLNTLSMMFCSSGSLMMYSVGPFVSYAVLHYILLSICAVTILLFPLLPKSPYYCVMKNDIKGAEESLVWLRGKSAQIVVEREMKFIKTIIKESQDKKGSFKDLFTSLGTRKALLICCVLLVIYQCSGATIIFFYSEKIFQMSGTNISTSACSIIVGFTMVLSAFISPMCVKRFGYKSPLLVSTFGMTVGMGGLGVFFLLKSYHFEVSDLNWLPLLSCVVYILFLNAGLANVPWALSGELFPNNIKSIATMFITVLMKLFAFITTNLFSDLVFHLGEGFLFLLCSFFSLLGGLFTIFYVKDTSGMSFVEIQDMLNGYKRKKPEDEKEVDQLF